MDSAKNREARFRDELKRKREDFMLEEARVLVEERGYQGFTLADLAKRTGYSKPTIYRYFPSMEDLMVALAVDSYNQRLGFYERVMAYPKARPRERLMLLHTLSMGVFNCATRDELNLHMENVRAKATPQRLAALEKAEDRAVEMPAAQVREAVKIGDLVLPEGRNEYHLVFALRALMLGGRVMFESEAPVVKRWSEKIDYVYSTFGRLFLDGLGWRPLSTEYDYLGSLKRLKKELFVEVEFSPLLGVGDPGI